MRVTLRTKFLDYIYEYSFLTGLILYFLLPSIGCMYSTRLSYKVLDLKWANYQKMLAGTREEEGTRRQR